MGGWMGGWVGGWVGGWSGFRWLSNELLWAFYEWVGGWVGGWVGETYVPPISNGQASFMHAVGGRACFLLEEELVGLEEGTAAFPITGLPGAFESELLWSGWVGGWVGGWVIDCWRRKRWLRSVFVGGWVGGWVGGKEEEDVPGGWWRRQTHSR